MEKKKSSFSVGESKSEADDDSTPSPQDDSSQAVEAEQDMLDNVIDFKTFQVEDVMCNRSDICALPMDFNISEFLGKYEEYGKHTRIPIYEESLDNIKGFVHIKDILLNIDNRDMLLSSIRRDILVVPPQMKAVNLLMRMKMSCIMIAVIVDEYGCTEGIVTISDLLNEIVGDVDDEHHNDNLDNSIIRMSESSVYVNASVDIEDVEEAINIDFKADKKEYGSIGGLVISICNGIPKTGSKIKHDSGITFVIEKADSRSIKYLSIYFAKD